MNCRKKHMMTATMAVVVLMSLGACNENSGVSLPNADIVPTEEIQEAMGGVWELTLGEPLTCGTHEEQNEEDELEDVLVEELFVGSFDNDDNLCTADDVVNGEALDNDMLLFDPENARCKAGGDVFTLKSVQICVWYQDGEGEDALVENFCDDNAVDDEENALDGLVPGLPEGVDICRTTETRSLRVNYANEDESEALAGHFGVDLVIAGDCSEALLAVIEADLSRDCTQNVAITGARLTEE